MLLFKHRTTSVPSSLLPQALFFVLSPSIIKEQYTVVNYSYGDLHTDIDILYVLTVYSLYKDGEKLFFFSDDTCI
jgi:hypothetical protein